jgi:hypothetical protein
MRTRLLLAVLAAGFAVFSPVPCHADIVILSDGKVLPPNVQVPPGEAPSPDQILETEDKRVDPLAYDTLKIGGREVSAGMVSDISITACTANADFQQGETNAASGFFEDAAANFGAAADGLKGPARQLALWKRLVAMAQLNDPDTLVPAIDAFVGEFPKTYFLSDVLQRKARGLMAKGDAAGAKAALDALTGAAGLNKRDLHGGELVKLQFEAGAVGRDKAKLAALETKYRERLAAIERESARDEVALVRLQAMVGVGRMLVFQDKPADARPFLEQVIDSPVAAQNRAMLAAAYAALGHVAYAEARATQAGAAGNEEQKKKAAGQLETALLHYMRVTEFYMPVADGGDLYDARISAARVLSAQFTLSNDKDCEAAKSSMRFYKLAYDMLSGGTERSSVNREYTELKTRHDKGCK